MNDEIIVLDKKSCTERKHQIEPIKVHELTINSICIISQGIVNFECFIDMNFCPLISSFPKLLQMF